MFMWLVLFRYSVIREFRRGRAVLFADSLCAAPAHSDLDTVRCLDSFLRPCRSYLPPRLGPLCFRGIALEIYLHCPLLRHDFQALQQSECHFELRESWALDKCVKGFDFSVSAFAEKKLRHCLIERVMESGAAVRIALPVQWWFHQLADRELQESQLPFCLIALNFLVAVGHAPNVQNWSKSTTIKPFASKPDFILSRD
eukprot:s2062_g20.t1